MKTSSGFLRHGVLLLACLILAPGWANAAVMGFGNFSGFTVNQNDSKSGPVISGGTIHLTGASSGEYRSIFDDTPQDITQFTASFTYQAKSVYAFLSEFGGAAFVLQNSPAGANAVGTATSLTAGATGINKSVEISLEFDVASSSSSGRYINGPVLGGASPTSPVNLGSGDPINVSLSYDGSVLQESLVDTITSASITFTYPSFNIPSVVGGSTAYVGLTAANTSSGGGDQAFSNFQFNNVPEPGSFGVLAAALVAVLLHRRG